MKHDTAVQIGSGGMGEVYRAWEPELQRFVALKYLRHDDPELVERLLREARAQARVDHPGICKVYEVGRDEGRPYISMQYVEGHQLDEVAAGLSLEQKVLLLRDVAEAVHAAHAVGLIHRDLKPGNILVSEDGDGRLRPYVLDFGIARQQEVAGLTRTGQVIGTPGYLSPEQARGEVGTLDRRTDIFSLGVILYELLAGRRPFAGDSQASELVELLENEPTPLRRVAPRLPRDLETVTITCLAKAPEQRYPSALALAEDLGRFFDGVPVLARRPGVTARLAARVRRYPRTSAFFAASLVALVVLAALAAHARWTAAQQAQVAQRFGQDVERVVGRLERAFLLPLHDIGPEARHVRERLAEIEAELDRLPQPLRALGESAIGRGHLALGEPVATREHLERAWRLGERSPQTAWALGLAFAELYRDAVQDANGYRTAELREETLRRLDVELRAPARDYLEQSAGGTEHQAYLAAHLALLSSDPDAALDHLAELERGEPFYYPGDLLAGSIHRARFEEASRSGDEDAADQAFARAEAAFLAAAEVGESDPRPYEELCGLWVVELRDRFWRSGGDLESPRDAALEACGKALTADPASPGAHIEASRANRFWAEHEAQLGHEDADALEAARRHAWQASAADPTNPSPYVLIGLTHRITATLRAERGDDPEEDLLAAVAAYREAIRLRPTDYGAHLSLANSQLILGDHARGEGRDPEPFFAAAVEAAERAVEIGPTIVGGHVNLGIGYAQLAITANERGHDSVELFARGTAALERAIELNPAFLNAHYNLGELLLEQAAGELRRGEDVRPHVEHGIELLTRTAEGYPTWSAPHYVMAEGLALQADWERRHGGDPGPLLDRAAAETAAGRAVHAGDAVGLSRACLAHLVTARRLADRDADPSAAVAAGLAQLDEALAVNPRLAPALVRRAELLAIRAAWWIPQGRSPTSDLDAAAASLREAEAVNPADAAAPIAAARIARLRARWALARGTATSEPLAAGLEAVERALAIDPTRAEAYAERAELHRTAAQAAADDSERDRALEDAAEADREAHRLARS